MQVCLQACDVFVVRYGVVWRVFCMGTCFVSCFSIIQMLCTAVLHVLDIRLQCFTCNVPYFGAFAYVLCVFHFVLYCVCSCALLRTAFVKLRQY